MNKKTRLNAIKRVASKKTHTNPVLTGYGIFGEYKCVTDSYHAIMIKEENIPLPLVITNDEIKQYGIDIKKYHDEHGVGSIIYAKYPSVIMNYFNGNFDRNNELTIDYDDLKEFIKNHKGREMALYKLGGSQYQAKFLKNMLDIIGKDSKIYYQGELQPLYFENEDKELGLVLPVRTY
jgi:hypothetical protein